MPARALRTFTVLPHLPERLQGLHRLAYNLWWCWNHDAIWLFRRIDEDRFVQLEHSPVKLLAQVGQDRLEQLAHDDGFLAHLDRVVDGLDSYLAADTWFQQTYAPRSSNGDIPAADPAAIAERYRIAYFSAEFGLHESIPIYSGGLGILAGDHLKSASDLGIPLVGVGLMYREGYFR
jgi:glycogen phosphorylase